MSANTLEACLAEVDRWKDAAATALAKMTPSEQLAHYKRVGESYQPATSRRRQQKGRRKKSSRAGGR